MEQISKPTVAVIGLGLMGGSLAASLSRAGIKVTGWDENPQSMAEAVKLGAIAELSPDLDAAVRQAEVIFLATPVELIAPVMAKCLPLTSPGTVFTDLGSIKELVINEVKKLLPPTHFFLPGHPMTGAEQHGISAADPFLFQNAAYLLIEDEDTNPKVLAKVASIVKLTGAHLLTLSAKEHDRIVGMVSHLPHLIASVLARTAGDAEEEYPGTLNLAAGGFRDTTRIALGDPKLWEGIILGNCFWVKRALEDFQVELTTLIEILNRNESNALRDYLGRAREIRVQLPTKNKGFLTLLYEMVVTIEDKPGTINNVLQYLAAENLNIKDIEILRVREGDGGTLRLALENSIDVEKAVQLLEAKGFKARKR